MQKLIRLFMWGYQENFRVLLELRAKQVLSDIGVDTSPRALLVGIRKPDIPGPNPVCIEPEFETCPLSIFTGINEKIEHAYLSHEDHMIFYGDQRTTDMKPERIRRDVVRAQIKASLEVFDAENTVISFCGGARSVCDYHVVPVLQLPRDLVEGYSRLATKIYFDGYRCGESLIQECMTHTLNEAVIELESSEPGENVFSNRRSAREIAQLAATSFMRAPLLATSPPDLLLEVSGVDLFQRLNQLSSLMYEKKEGVGRLLLVDPGNPHIRYALRFPSPVPFRDARWSRKLLQMASGDVGLIADGSGIHGLGTLDVAHKVDSCDAFWVDFFGQGQWALRLGLDVLIQSRFGEPSLPNEAINWGRFEDNFRRVIDGSSETDANVAWRIVKEMVRETHGSMVVFARDAAEEAKRLSKQGMAISPVPLTDELLSDASKIDGSILVDATGVCHAIGVILDGEASDQCTAARGSRYNSAVRYVMGSQEQRLAVVKSEDGGVDILPLLRPRIERRRVLEAIEALESATLENYHKPRSFLDEHRFYAMPEDCLRINSALDRLEELPMDLGQIRILTKRFTPDPQLDRSYYF
jgi:hypothetical protein